MPIYPDDFLDEQRKMRLDIQRLFTSINSKQPYGKVEFGPLIVGRVGNRMITMNPDGATNPEIWLDPDGTGANPTRISAQAGSGGTANLVLQSGSSGGVSSRLTLAYNEVSMESGSGGFAFWGSSEARFGYSTNNYFQFGASICQHIGQWNDVGGSLPSTAGLLWGSITIGGSATSGTINYPANMASNIGPSIGLRHGNPAADFYWSISASSTSGVTVVWSKAGSVALYIAASRH
ncbi:hypothetical protein [Acrocarpospora sp. B8E8]|uniref:hypothetical protein n=1 Tax=Acrocarpospora sp. B8E8 TaxID=3153572 RepID=UPI00325EC6AB